MDKYSGDDIKVVLFSDNRYEKLTAEIQVDGEPIAQVSQENGKNFMEVEFFSFENLSKPRLPLDELIRKLTLAKENLMEYS